jgi:hypothetical protein
VFVTCIIKYGAVCSGSGTKGLVTFTVKGRQGITEAQTIRNEAMKKDVGLLGRGSVNDFLIFTDCELDIYWVIIILPDRCANKNEVIIGL